MRSFPRLQMDRVALTAIAVLAIGSAALLVPNLERALRPAVTKAPTLTYSPPPAAVLLADERDRALQSIVILTVDAAQESRVGSAFAIDGQGDLLTSADLVSGARALRVIDNTGGSHPARLVAVDPAVDLALVRTPLGLPPLTVPSPGVQPAAGSPAEILAPPKNAGLPESTPALITGVKSALIDGTSQAVLKVQADVYPAHSGAPVLGPGAVLYGVVILVSDSEVLSGTALPIASALSDLQAWPGRPGSALPLASLPNSLVLRGDTGPAPTPSTAAALQVTGCSPTRAVSSVATVLTLHGAGFVAGRALRVHFAPVASPGGGFDGLRLAVVAADTITVTVPAGEPVEDYVVQLTNGDGSAAGAGPTFTVVP